MNDFLVSYNRNDREWAEWIAWQLEAQGYAAVIQAWDFRPGGNFVVDMHEAATKAQRTIAVLSPDYLESRFTAPEWAAAFAQDSTGVRALLVPVRVRECQPEDLLRQIVYIDLARTQRAKREGTFAPGSQIRGRQTVRPVPLSGDTFMASPRHHPSSQGLLLGRRPSPRRSRGRSPGCSR